MRTCKSCAKIYNDSRAEERKVLHRAWYQANKELAAEQSRAKNYGLPFGAYTKMMELQSGACAICKRVDKKLHVDHNHSTGDVRQLLCARCNMNVGFLESDLAATAAAYVQRHSARSRGEHSVD